MMRIAFTDTDGHYKGGCYEPKEAWERILFAISKGAKDLEFEEIPPPYLNRWPMSY